MNLVPRHYFSGKHTFNCLYTNDRRSMIVTALSLIHAIKISIIFSNTGLAHLHVAFRSTTFQCNYNNITNL